MTKKLLLMFALAGTLAFSPLCLAQTTVALSPLALPQFLNNNGQPCSGCKLSTFSAGTTSNLVTYSESTGTTPNSNPIIMDSSGRPSNGSANVEIFLTSASYKFKMTDANNVQLWVVDNITWATPLSTFSGITSTGNSIIRPAVAATGGANQSSPTLCIDGFYFNISSLTDQWCLSDVLGTGNAPTTTFTVTHAGSGGTATINLPNVAVSGIFGLTNAGDETNSATSTVKWGSSGVLTPDTGLSRVSAGVLGAGNGTQGSNTATVQAGGFWINSGAGGVWNFVASMFDQISTGGVRWSSGANATTGIDTGITRGGAAATVAVGNGTAGDASGTLKAAAVILNGNTLNGVTGTGTAVVTNTGPTISRETINTGVSQGSGFKHQRFANVCTTAASAFGVCTATLTWTSAFADASYSVVCQVGNVANPEFVNQYGSKAAASVLVQFANMNHSTATLIVAVDCIAIHD